MSRTTAAELRQQWKNPGDLLSLLLLIGGDIVQKAIAQTVGYTINFTKKGQAKPCLNGIPLTPVAFSFGWVAFGFSQLLSALGDRRLLPSPENSAIVVNCANTFQRDNRSWILERLLRDHEIRNPVEEGTISMRIDIFELGALQTPKLDYVWWLGWLTIIAEIGLAIPPWVLHGDWSILMIVLAGSLLALVSCSLPQWREEKWAGRISGKEKVMCLTRGNGHKHVMMLLCHEGAPDLETFATAKGSTRIETPIVTTTLAGLWLCLLLSVSGLKEHTWYLLGAGALGMLQNVYAAGVARDPSTAGLHLSQFERMPTIVGRTSSAKADENADVDLNATFQDVSALDEWINDHKSDVNRMPTWLKTMTIKDGAPEWLVPVRDSNDLVGVHGALKELEKWIPGAGFALLPIFFPGSLGYDDDNVRDNVNKKFWKRAWHTRGTRHRAEKARRKTEHVVVTNTV